MLKVYVQQQLAGSLFKPQSEPYKYHFGCRAKQLAMYLLRV